MSESVYFITIGLIMATVLIPFGMRYFAQVQLARAQAAGSADHAAALKAIAATLADVQARLAGIEKILKQVE